MREREKPGKMNGRREKGKDKKRGKRQRNKGIMESCSKNELREERGGKEKAERKVKGEGWKEWG
jgi:hypothetical protein